MLKNSIAGVLLAVATVASAASGTISVSNQTASASLAGAPNSSAYLTITNNGDADTTLVAIEANISKRIEIHDMTVIDGIMKMKALPELIIPAKKSVSLQPGGKHLMILNLNEPLQEGKSFTATLKFKNGESTPVTFPIKGRK